MFVSNLIQDESAFSFCYRRRNIFVCSWSSTRQHWKVIPRAANTTLFVNILPTGSKRYIAHKNFTHALQKYCGRIINSRASIWREQMLAYVSLDVVCSSKLTVLLELRSRINCSHLGKDNVRGQIFVHVFAPNGGFSLNIPCIQGTWLPRDDANKSLPQPVRFLSLELLRFA